MIATRNRNFSGFAISRRHAVMVFGAALTASPTLATADARLESASEVVSNVILRGNELLNSGRKDEQIVADLEDLLHQYADIPLIARYAMGRAWRFATSDQRRKFVDTFASYLANKYIRYFPDFVGGRFKIVRARYEDEHYIEVLTHTTFEDGETKSVRWLVLAKSDTAKVVNFLFIGLNMLTLERKSIERMLAQYGNDIDQLIEGLPRRRS